VRALKPVDAPVVSAPLPPAGQLRQGALSQAESLGQSIANIGPTLMPAISIAVVAGHAGRGSWLAYLVATLGMMFVAANIAALARRHPQSGSYFLYIGRNFGPLAGAIAGWSMIAAYLFTGVAVTVSVAIFVSTVMGEFGLGGLVPPAPLVITGFVGLIWFAGYRDIQFSSRLALVLEGISITIIIAVIALVARWHGSLIDPGQLDIAKLPIAGVVSALPFAVFSFVGFESAATLAQETRNPHVAVPRAIMGSAIGVGVFFAAIAYLMVLGVGGDAGAIAGSGTPFADLTARAGLGLAAPVIYVAAIISSFACVLASVNAASRLLFSMGRYSFFNAALGTVHDRHRTPHVAVTLACGIILIASLAMLPFGLLDAFGLAGTFATLGFLVVYLLVCLVAPVDLRRNGGLAPKQAFVAVIGTLLVCFVLVGSVWPLPPYPYNVVPYLFAAYMLAGGLWFAQAARRRPGVLAAIEHDLEM
jgi:amino acid transporter